MAEVLKEFVASIGLQADPASFNRAEHLLAGIGTQLQAMQKELGKTDPEPVAEKTESAGARMVGALKAAGGPIIAVTRQIADSFADIFNQFGELATGLARASSQFGVSAQALQGLGHVGAAAGVDFGSLKGVLTNLQSQMYALTTGSAEAFLAFSRLGVSVRDSATGKFKPATQVFEEAIEKLIETEDPVMRTGKALATVGQAGLDIANRFAGRGIAAFREMRAEVALFGAELRGEDIAAVQAYGEEQSRIGLIWQGFKNAIGGPLHQVMAQLTKDFVDWTKTQGGEGQNVLREAVQGFQKLGPAILDLAKGFFKFASGAFPVVLQGLTGLAYAAANVAVVLKDGVLGAMRALGDAGPAVAIGLAFAFAPLTSTLIGIGLLVEDIIVFSKGGDSLIGRALDAFPKVKSALIGSPEDRPYLFRFFEELFKMLTVGIPQAIRTLIDLLAEAFVWVGRIVGPIAKAIDALDSKARKEISQDEIDKLTDASNAGNKSEVERQLGAIRVRVGPSPFDAAPSSAPSLVPFTQVAAPTAPIANVPGYGGGGGGGPQVVRQEYNATVQVTGAKGDPREIAKIVEEKLDEGWKAQLARARP